MANNCICNLMSGIGSFIIGSLRVILFVICILSFLGEIFRAWALFMAETYLSEFNFPLVSDIHPGAYVQVVGLAILALIGAHGAYSKNPKYLKTYALCVSIYAVLYFLVTITVITTTDWNKHTNDFDEQMKDYAKKYQFDLKPGEEPNKATKAWDIVQASLACCGLERPRDWLDWGFTTKQILPRTCCAGFNFPQHPDVCKIDEPWAFTQGCDSRIRTILDRATLSAFLTPLFYLVYASIAVIVAKQQEPDYGSPASSGAAPRADGTNYQRFDGSVYVRQPAMNEAYVPSNKPAPGAQMYPTIMSDSHGSSPPPSYVARA